jgi:hypothetical protein
MKTRIQSESATLSAVLMQSTFDRLKAEMPDADDPSVVREMYRRWDEADRDARAIGNAWMDFVKQ